VVKIIGNMRMTDFDAITLAIVVNLVTPVYINVRLILALAS